MDTRPLGETGHDSTLVSFGAIALNWLEQEGANQLVELLLDHGVDHVDVAPTYGDAELKLGPKLRQHREAIFLGCKTQERGYEGARRELERSLDRLGVDTIDLYQVHGLEAREELDAITEPDGALAAIREAREEGLVEHIGLTSHGQPALVRGALDRVEEFETVMFPLNPVVAAKDDEEYDYGAVLDQAETEGVGTLGIKAFTKGPWPPAEELAPADRPYATWYEPVGTPTAVQERFDFAAAQGLTSVVTPGDPKLVAMVLAAAQRYDGMDETAQEALLDRHRDEESPVPQQLHH